jgi:hypothetical protein
MSQVAVVHFPDFHFDYYSLILHKTKPEVLIVVEDNGWNLPSFIPYEHHFGVVNHINLAIKAQLRLDVTVLRCFYEDYSLETKTGCRVYAMENHSLQWLPPKNACWLGLTELQSIKFTIPKIHEIIHSFLSEINQNDLPAQRVPWAKTGWFEQATAWIHSQLSAQGINMTAPIEQVKSQTRSCLLKVNTTVGDVYFKATFGQFSFEPQITTFLSEIYPKRLPKLLAVDTQKYWMLMPDFCGTHLGKMKDVDKWEKALSLFAQMQIQAVAQISKFLDTGLPDRPIERLISKIEPLFADKCALLSPQKAPILSENQIDRLRSLAPQLITICYELANCGIPQTLIHGDFHCDNVMVTDEGYIYFDWSESAVSHPFFDAIFFLHDITQELPNVTDVQVRLRNSYLEPWTVYLPMEQLISLFEKAQLVAALYYAVVSYEVTQNLEAGHKWEMEEAVPYWLEILLAQINTLLG